MKIFIFCSVAFISTCVALYGVWSFAWMDFNPNNWGMESRITLSYFSFFIGAMAAAAVGIGMNNAKDKSHREDENVFDTHL